MTNRACVCACSCTCVPFLGCAMYDGDQIGLRIPCFCFSIVREDILAEMDKPHHHERR